MSPLGLAVQQPDPYMAGCAAPAADCPSNTSRAALGQEDHACCPFDPASSSCCSTQQHFVPLSPHHTLSYGTKTLNPVQEVEGEKGGEGKKIGGYGGGEGRVGGFKKNSVFSSLQHQQALTTAAGVFLGPDTALRHLLLDASPSLLF